MKTELVYCFRLGWHWIAQGMGELRPIIVEADTREEARKGWTEQYGIQYEEAQKATALSIYMEENQTELRELAHGYRNYKGVH